MTIKNATHTLAQQSIPDKDKVLEFIDQCVCTGDSKNQFACASDAAVWINDELTYTLERWDVGPAGYPNQYADGFRIGLVLIDTFHRKGQRWYVARKNKRFERLEV